MEERKECGALIKKINDELEKNANNVLRAEDLTFSQIGALLELNSAPEGQLTLKELEKRLHVAQSTAAGITSRLELKALVEAFAIPRTDVLKSSRSHPKELSGCRRPICIGYRRRSFCFPG